jgi:hypothetical protein
MGVCVTNMWLAPATGSNEREQEVRVRAYEIWERTGRAGRPEDHWFQAEVELELDAPARDSVSTGATPRAGGDPQDQQR